MTWVKICGTTSLEDARAAVSAGANALGFIFAPGPREVSVDIAAAIIATLPPTVEKVGVFVNELPEHVAETAARVGLTVVQLHGDEPAAALADFRAALGSRKIIRTLQVRKLLASPKDLAPYLDAACLLDGVLLDSGSPAQRGGTGVPFPWQEAASLAAKIRQVLPLIVAGGLDADNVGEAIRLFSPFGVDVVSGVESGPGKKDKARLHSFVKSVRQAEELAAAHQA